MNKINGTTVYLSVIFLLLLLIMAIMLYSVYTQNQKRESMQEVCVENRVFKDVKIVTSGLHGQYTDYYYIQDNGNLYRSSDIYPLNQSVCTKNGWVNK